MYPSVITSSEPCSAPPGVDEQVRSDRLSVSHKESSVPSVQLEYTDTGQVGPANSARVHDRFYPDTLPILPTPTDSNITRQSCSGDTRSTGTGQERGCNRDNCLCNQFHLPDFPGREKRGGTTSSHQPEGSEPVCAGGALQDGRVTPPSRPNPARGLDDKIGPKRCLSTSANPRSSSMLPSVCLGRETIQISMSSIWPVISAKGVYKAPETSGGPSQADRPTLDNIPGRHAIHAWKQGPARDLSTNDSKPIRGLGPHGEQSKITFNTNSTDRVFGVSDQLVRCKALLTPRKEQEITTGSIQASPTPSSISKRIGSIHWEGYSNLQGTVASPTTLQSLTEEAQFSNNGERLPGAHRQVHSSSHDGPGNDKRPSMVVNNGIVVPRDIYMYPKSSSTGVGIGCIPEGMGSTMYGNQHRGSLVTYRSAVPHQLPRVISCLPSPQDLCKQPERFNLAEDGQCIRSDVHQPKGWHTFNTIVQSSTGDLGVVYPERDNATGRTSAWQSQHSGRHRIPGDQGPMRLDDQPKSVPTITTIAGTTGDRLVRISTDQATTPILQLEARSRSRGNRCLPTGLDTSAGVCQSPMVLNTTMSEPDKTTTGKSVADNATLALPILVPSPSRDATGLPSSASTTTGPDIEPLQSGIHNATGDSDTGRMAYLRESFSSRGISAQASGLLLASWRDKTNTSYNSLFAKWANWCEQRSRDPTAGPVEDVINFLAELFAEGYQYRSLNAYRSAISSIHQKVDGQNIGQHPLVCRLLKGSYNQKPPTPRYTHFWDVGVVLRFIKQLGTNPSLSLKWLSIKTAMLMALTRPSRSADLSKLDIRFRTYTAKGVIFQPTHLSKQSRSSKPIREFFFPSYPTDDNICPVRALQVYEERTSSFREKNTKLKSTLFLSWIGKHDPVSSSTIARWLRMCLQEAGINTDTFKAHSIRGAAGSSAAWSGVTIMDILNAADWSSETTFQQFYHREMQDRSTFGSAVLSSASSSNLHVDMETEPSEM